ncbi:MAG: hypothetical protein HQL26_09950 [Candidatus Omnitrophica bacterium]|nr:hypothetical protein [Candidatus Omnitrophota bacterium]
MLNPVKWRNCLISFMASFLLCCFQLSCFAEKITGEIINTNTKLKIVFSDLGNFYLSEGDIVKLYKNGQFEGFLKVLDATSAISKLGTLDEASEFKTTLDFNKISIGDTVEKYENPNTKKPIAKATSDIKEAQTTPAITPVVSKPLVPTRPEPAEIKNFDKYFNQYSNNYEELSKTLNKLIEDKHRLQEQWSETSNKLADEEAQIQGLRAENERLKNQAEKIPKSVLTDQCLSEQQEINRLKENIEVLKNKLRNLISIVERKLNSNE